jgi:hypothetical protein
MPEHYRSGAGLAAKASVSVAGAAAARRASLFFWRLPYATVQADKVAAKRKGVTVELVRAVPVEVLYTITTRRAASKRNPVP